MHQIGLSERFLCGLNAGRINVVRTEQRSVCFALHFGLKPQSLRIGGGNRYNIHGHEECLKAAVSFGLLSCVPLPTPFGRK